MSLPPSNTDYKIADTKYFITVSPCFHQVLIFWPPVFLHWLPVEIFSLFNINGTRGLGCSFTQISLQWLTTWFWWHKGCLQHQDKDCLDRRHLCKISKWAAKKLRIIIFLNISLSKCKIYFFRFFKEIITYLKENNWDNKSYVTDTIVLVYAVLESTHSWG